MIEACCNFPQKVLASTAFTISGGVSVRVGVTGFLDVCLPHLFYALLLNYYISCFVYFSNNMYSIIFDCQY